MNLKRKDILKIYKLILFIPILIYLGDRSLIAFDEGFYALQAKWILNSNNWIAPMWWGEISLDRTIGIQALIALSQKIFGLLCGSKKINHKIMEYSTSGQTI